MFIDEPVNGHLRHLLGVAEPLATPPRPGRSTASFVSDCIVRPVSWLISQLTLNISGSSQQWFYRLFISATCKGHVHLELLYACSSSHIVTMLVQCITAGYLGADAIEVFISEQMLLKCSNRLLISAACKGCVHLRLLNACSSSHQPHCHHTSSVYYIWLSQSRCCWGGMPD